MFDNPELAYEILREVPVEQRYAPNGQSRFQRTPDFTFRQPVYEEQLTREIKEHLLENIHNWSFVEPVIASFSAPQLVELENYLWKEATEYAQNTLQKKLAREFITRRIEPTSSYHRRQICSEPLIACRANYCVYSNPNCAGRKLREHIQAISSIFDRRTRRSNRWQDAIDTFLQHMINKLSLFGIIVTNSEGAPIAAISELENRRDISGSDFVRTFFAHLGDYIAKESDELTRFGNVNVNASSQRIQLDKDTFIVTLLSIHDVDFYSATDQVAHGIRRIFSNEFSPTTRRDPS